MRRLALFLIWLFLAPLAIGQTGAVMGFCTSGATSATTQGLTSTNKLQGIIPSCTVTVYLAGTQTLATLYSNSSSTPLANPFSASPTGQWIFFVASSQKYDVVGSGGIQPNVYPTPQVLVAAGSASSGGAFLPLAGGTLYGALTASNINGELFPASCGSTAPDPYCSGTTAGAWITAACNALPSTGGFISFRGLNGVWPNQIDCTTDTKQVIFIQDPTSSISITEQDGKPALLLANNSMLLGPGAGQSRVGTGVPFGGIWLSSTANVEAIVRNQRIDGTQEQMAVMGVSLWGFTGATVGKGLVELNHIYTNTTVANSNFNVCNHACIWVEDSGSISIYGNEFNVTDGAYGVLGIPVNVLATGVNGCGTQSINIWGADSEHANGGAANPEVNATGDGVGAQVCSLHVHDLHVERNVAGTPATIGINLSDCLNCTVDSIEFAGGSGSGSSGDAIRISETAPGRSQNVQLYGIANYFDAYQNTVNDTTQNGKVLPLSQYPYITSYVAHPGYQQPPVLPSNTIESLDKDLMGNQGNLAAGSGTFGAGFQAYGCQTPSGVTCTFTRTNSTAPPGYLYSQEVQITANTDPSVGNNGIEYATPVAVMAGKTYAVSFWGMGDGTFTGIGQFILGDPTVPNTQCIVSAPGIFTSTWTLYSGTCLASITGNTYLSFSALSTPLGVTGTFYLGGMNISPVSPMPPGSIIQAVGPYGIGPITPLPTQTSTCTSAINGNSYMVADVTTFTSGATYVPGGSNTAPIVCSYNGSAYAWKVF